MGCRLKKTLEYQYRLLVTIFLKNILLIQNNFDLKGGKVSAKKYPFTQLEDSEAELEHALENI
jgi:hypothetical protein